MLSDALGLGLLWASSCCCLGLLLGGFASLLALCFGIFGGVPGFEDLKAWTDKSVIARYSRELVKREKTHVAVLLFVIELATAHSVGRGGRRRGIAVALLLVCTHTKSDQPHAKKRDKQR